MLALWVSAFPSRATEFHPEAGCGASGEARGRYVSANVEPCSPAPKPVEPDSPARGPRCSWEPATASDYDPVPGLASSAQLFRDAVTERPVSAAGPGVEALYRVRCPYGTGPVELRWSQPAEYVDRQALIASAYDDARSAVPPPSLDIWPAQQHGVPVQYGMWLAVDQPGQVNAFAEVGPVWASVTARFVGATYDMGNGDEVECPGLGTPYPHDLDPLDYSQGPCGYTFTREPDLGVRQLAATGHWEVALVTSDGVNETLDPIDVTYTFDYEVYEVETVVVR